MLCGCLHSNLVWFLSLVNLFLFTLSYSSSLLFYLNYFSDYYFHACLFLRREKKGVDWDRKGGGKEELRSVGGATIIRIYPIEKNLFSVEKWEKSNLMNANIYLSLYFEQCKHLF